MHITGCQRTFGQYYIINVWWIFSVRHKTNYPFNVIIYLHILYILFYVFHNGKDNFFHTESVYSPSKQRKGNSIKDVLLCFSVVKNWKKLLAVGKGERHLSALGGIRVLSLSWVILGHMFDFSQVYMGTV